MSDKLPAFQIERGQWYWVRHGSSPERMKVVTKTTSEDAFVMKWGINIICHRSEFLAPCSPPWWHAPGEWLVGLFTPRRPPAN
jgi:hypothetical protein